MKPLIKNLVYTVLFMTITFELFTCKKLVNNLRSFLEDKDSDIIISSDDESKLMDAIEQLDKKNRTIYINTTVINIKKNSMINLTGDFFGGIIGLRQINGEYPRINFVNEDESKSGINIIGSNKCIQFIIIEKAHGNGVSILGDYNFVNHVVSRYNYGSGFVVYGDNNVLNYCYSYKNCDATIKSVNADGFRIYGEKDNIFNFCFAWENANSGFNYVSTKNSTNLRYVHCGSWNNGNINVFTGKYDYDLGNVLDKNLWTIQEIIKSDSKFVTNYYNKKYNIDNAYLDGVKVKEWVAKVEPKMGGNGFTFGSQNSSQSSDAERSAFLCVAFDNKNGGFIDIVNHKYKAEIENCAAFNNYINYKLSYTFSKWSDNWSWASKDSDQLNKVVAKKPNNADKLYKGFYSTRDNIVKATSQNIFPDTILYADQISSLAEEE